MFACDVYHGQLKLLCAWAAGLSLLCMFHLAASAIVSSRCLESLYFAWLDAHLFPSALSVFPSQCLLLYAQCLGFRLAVLRLLAFLFFASLHLFGIPLGSHAPSCISVVASLYFLLCSLDHAPAWKTFAQSYIYIGQ